MHGIVYLITNTVNGKQYVGQTVLTLDQRWRQHQGVKSRCRALLKAIQKHGAEMFRVEVIAEAKCSDDLNALERQFVEQLGTLAPRGYNLKEGGGAKGRWSEPALEKMREQKASQASVDMHRKASQAMWQRDDVRARISDAIRAGLARPEVREKRSAIAKQRVADPVVRARMSSAQSGRFARPEEREKVSADSARRWADPLGREKMLQARAKLSSDPAYIEKVSSSVKALWQDPEYRARMTAAQQAGKARKKALLAAAQNT